MKWLGILLLVEAVFSASQNPDENLGINDKNLFEGDMILPPDERYRAEHGEDVDSSRKRGSIRNGKWPLGVVPYVIDPSLAGNSRAVNAISAGMNEWTTKTCIRFKRRTNERGYVNFVFGNGCSSLVGRVDRRQDITLASGCWYLGIVAHEIGHAIGFFHEQSRPDRDNFVTVRLANVLPGLENNFRKYERSTIDSLGTPYDYGSLMHYGSTAFTKNGLPTIDVKTPGAVIGQRRGLSSIDAQQANLLYRDECAKREGGPTPTPSQGNECSNYRVLSTADRAQGNALQNNVRCDRRDLQTPGWYRFMGAAGNQIPNQCVPVRRCGTHAPGWLNGAHPRVQDGIVTRQVCYNWNNNCCRWRNNIRVKNCGGFFVYELQRTPVCALRYCGDASAGSVPTTIPPTTAPSPTTSASCQDRSRRCRLWPVSFCRLSYIKRNCRKHCGLCRR